MYIEKDNSAKRKIKNIKYDINYLKEYFKKHKKYPDFTQVLIETRTDCNKKCSFCPQSHVKKDLGIMENETFFLIIDKLVEIGFAGRIALFLSNEPLLDNRLPMFIKYIKEKTPRFFIDITTNGTLLTLKKTEELLSAGIDNININDYRSDRETNYNKISSNLKKIVNIFKANPKINYFPRSSNEQLSNYAGNIDSFKKTNLGFCNFPFRKLVFSYKGDILLCCNDFQYKTNFGNIHNDNLLDVWHSSEFNEYRHNLLNNKRIKFCSNCDQTQTYSIY